MAQTDEQNNITWGESRQISERRICASSTHTSLAIVIYAMLHWSVETLCLEVYCFCSNENTESGN